VLPTATPIALPSPTPTPTEDYTPTPEFSDVYAFDAVGVSIRYPDGWAVSPSEISISFEDEDRRIYLIFFPAGARSGFDNNPIAALADYILFSSMALPDKQPLHLASVNGSEIAFGVYGNPGESEGFNNPSPLFIAMLYTEDHTIAAEFIAPPGNEDENRMIFEMVLASLPPSVFSYAESTPAPTLVPADTLVLPVPPKGFHWQGVENIEFALPVPEGWYVRFEALSEMWNLGLQEYEYRYFITRDDPVLTGNFFSGGMLIFVSKDSDTDASAAAAQLFANIQTGPGITKVIDSRIDKMASTDTYQIHVELVDSRFSPASLDYERTVYLVYIADLNANILYFVYFDATTNNWEDEWETGQVMVLMLLELLQK